MSVSFDKASTLQAAISHQCSRDADGDGERGRNGYPSDSVEAALIRDKLHVVPSEDHDQMEEEASDSKETPYSSSGTDSEGVGATVFIVILIINVIVPCLVPTSVKTRRSMSLCHFLYADVITYCC